MLNLNKKVCQILREIVNIKDFDGTLSSLPASDCSTCFEKLRPWRAGTGYNRSTARQWRSSSGHHRRRSRRSGDCANSTELQSARSAHLLAAKFISRSLSLKPLTSSASYIDTRPYVDGGGPDVAPPCWSDT